MTESHAEPLPDPPLTLALLGPMTVRRGDRIVEVKGRLTRMLLARLAAARTAPVPTGLLIEDLWPRERPADPHEAVHSFVYALRRTLEPARRPRTAPTVLVSAGTRARAGYALRLASGAVDVWRFDDAVRMATLALSAGRSEEAARHLDAALGLWRGRAYADFAGQPWTVPEAARLETLRDLAVECLIDTADRVPSRPARHPYPPHPARRGL